jgi:hypothetical protein
VVWIITHGGYDSGSRLVGGVGNEEGKRKGQNRVKAGEGTGQFPHFVDVIFGRIVLQKFGEKRHLISNNWLIEYLLSSFTFWKRKLSIFKSYIESGCLTSFGNLQALKHPLTQQ